MHYLQKGDKMTKEDANISDSNRFNGDCREIIEDISSKCSDYNDNYHRMNETNQSVTKNTSIASDRADSSLEDVLTPDNDVPTFVTEILNEICDKINYCDNNNRDIPRICVHSNKEIKEYNRKTFVFDDSVLDEEENDVEELSNLPITISEFIENDFEGSLDENCNNKKKFQFPIVTAKNNSLINKYEIRAISKSSEILSPSKSEVPKRQKKFSLSSVFRKKDKSETKAPTKSKTEIEHETYDEFNPFENFSNFPSKATLSKSRRFSSAMDLSDKSASIPRTPSFKKKLANLQTETKALIRSLSFRDLSKKKEKEKLSVLKKSEWKSSLQRLVETDPGVSYDDLSFVNYDQWNTVSYNASAPKKKDIHVHRTQSLMEKVGPNARVKT